MAKKLFDFIPLYSGDIPASDDEEPTETVSIEETSEEEASEVSKKIRSAMQTRTIRLKDTGSITQVGWRTAMMLVNRGRAEYVEE